MRRWIGLFLVLGAMAGWGLFGHRSTSSAADNTGLPPMAGQPTTWNQGAPQGSPAWTPPVIAPANAGPAGAPPSIEPGRTADQLTTPPASPLMPPPSGDELTAPPPPPQFMIHPPSTHIAPGVQANVTLPPANATPVSMPMPINTLPNTMPVAPAQPQAPPSWPPQPFQSAPITSGAVPASESTGQARLAGGIESTPMHLSNPSAPTTVAFKVPANQPPEHLSPSFQAQPAIENAPITAAGVRLINSKRFSLAYEVKDVGPSGLAGVELWYTQDGKTWQRHPSPLHHHSPYVIEVGDEDLYGFTLVAHNGSGISMETPKAGDLPQVWVEVDVTSPVVRLLGVESGTASSAGHVTVLWSASDKHLGAKPITISYSEHTEGPWTPVASRLENTGRYSWQITPGMPLRFYVRVEATDEAGNMGHAQTSMPIVGDLVRPTISILGVAAAAPK